MAANAENKVAIITGASSGIGQATALEFARQGYHVVLAARRAKLLREVAMSCEELGVRALHIATDTSDGDAVQRLTKAALDEFGHLDVWVNAAAVYMTGKFQDLPLDAMRRLMDVNFFGYIHGSYSALRQFRTQGYGTLINISSINAAAPQPYVSIYSASKAAIRAFDESLRMELKLDGLDREIHVCTVMPASFDTNLFQNGANYSGRRVQALEPVYDPAYAAKQITGLVARPKREIKIGPAGRMMAFQNAHSPRMYEKQIGQFTDKDLFSEDMAPATAGNLFEPIEDNVGMYGGWRGERLRADHLNAGIGIGLGLAAGLAGLGVYLLKRSND